MTATGTAINAPESLLAMANPTEIAKKLTLKIELFLYNLIFYFYTYYLIFLNHYLL